MGQTPKPPPEFYQDSAVVAYRVPAGDVPFADLRPTVTSSGGTIDAALSRRRLSSSSVPLPMAPVGEKAWIQIEFAQAQTRFAACRWRLPGSSGRSARSQPDPTSRPATTGSRSRKIVEHPAQHGGAEHRVVPASHRASSG